MATFRKRKRKNGFAWQAIVRRGDAPAQRRTFPTKREAQEWATSVEDAINRDEFVPDAEFRKRQVRDLLERYKSSEAIKKARSDVLLSHCDWWADRIGHRRIIALSRSEIIEIRDREVQEGRAPATMNRYLATLRHAFNLAVTDWEWAQKNPLEKVMLTEPRGRDRHLDDDEIKRLLDASKASSHPYMYLMVLIALTTGARRGEIEAMRWQNVDFKNQSVLLPKTKNDSSRVLGLLPEVIDQLNGLRKVRRIDSDEVFVRPNQPGRRTYPSFQNAFNQVRDEAGLEDFRFHDLRHTFASRMAMNGKSLREIAEALGHKTLSMVQRYSHLTTAHVQSAMVETARGILGD